MDNEPFRRWVGFQSTPLCEGRRSTRTIPPASTTFQSTPLCEGRRQANRRHRRGDPCFNPRPSARGDVAAFAQSAEVGVSIHAPLRGATWPTTDARESSTCFNPRPSARGDLMFDRRITEAHQFQSTPLCEGRHWLAGTDRLDCEVSIHAPLRGATGPAAGPAGPRRCFNPRPSARGDFGRVEGAWRSRSFNPRPSARGDDSRSSCKT